MKVKIDVDSKQQGEIIAAALQDDVMRAFVIVCGALKPLSQRARSRVLEFVLDSLNEHKGNGPYLVDGATRLAGVAENEAAEQGVR